MSSLQMLPHVVPENILDVIDALKHFREKNLDVGEKVLRLSLKKEHFAVFIIYQRK